MEISPVAIRRTCSRFVAASHKGIQCIIDRAPSGLIGSIFSGGFPRLEMIFCSAYIVLILRPPLTKKTKHIKFVENPSKSPIWGSVIMSAGSGQTNASGRAFNGPWLLSFVFRHTQSFENGCT